MNSRIAIPCTNLAILIILLVILTSRASASKDIIFNNTDSLSSGSFSQHGIRSKNSGEQLLDHDPIMIDGNDDFTNQAIDENWSGKGTREKPYNISNYKIICLNSEISGISIMNTDLFFQISNCLVTGGRYHGIYLRNTFNCLITGNDIQNNGDEGIRISTSVNIIITNNFIAHHAEMGVRIFKSSYISIKDNFVHYNSPGIGLTSSTCVNLVQNTVTNNSGGGWTFSGIYLYRSNDNNITCNIISTNEFYGLGLANCWNNTIVSNNFIDNNIDHAQAFDLQVEVFKYTKRAITEKKVRLWTDNNLPLNIFTNNYWNDWTTPDEDKNGIVDQPYDIDGRGNKDPYPLVNPVVMTVAMTASNSQVHGWTFPVLVAAVLIPVLVRRKKKTN